MAETGAGLVILTVFWWIPGAWVFFDAEERDYSAYLWGAVSLVFGLLGVIVYFIVRSRRPATPAPYSRGRIYLHVGLLTSWGLVMIAAAAALWGFFQWVGAEEPRFMDRDRVFRDSLAFSIATLVIAAPAFFAHLTLLWRRIAESPDLAVRVALARMQEGMAWLTVVVAGIIGAFGVTALVFGGVGAMLDVGGISRDGGAAALAATLVPAFSLLASLIVFFSDSEYQRGRTLREQHDAADGQSVMANSSTMAPDMVGVSDQPAPPLDAVRTVSAFCSACGRERPPGARFCAGCGVAFGDETPA